MLARNVFAFVLLALSVAVTIANYAVRVGSNRTLYYIMLKAGILRQGIVKLYHRNISIIIGWHIPYRSSSWLCSTERFSQISKGCISVVSLCRCLYMGVHELGVNPLRSYGGSDLLVVHTPHADHSFEFVYTARAYLSCPSFAPLICLRVFLFL